MTQGFNWHKAFKAKAEERRLKKPASPPPATKKRKRTREQEAVRMRARRARYREAGLTGDGKPVQDLLSQARSCRAWHQELCHCRPCRYGRRHGL